jgi:hypothetical protein
MAEKAITKRKRIQAYKRKLKALQSKGIYIPKDEKLTKYRKTQINKRYRQFQNEIESGQFFFVKAPNKQVLKQAKQLSMETTRTGIFIEKQGAKRATIRKNRQHKGEYEIRLSGKVKRGERRGKSYETIIPISPLDVLDDERNRLRKMAQKFGKLSKKERLAFRIVETGNEGYSRSVFQNIETLIKYLDKYRKSDSERVQFLRHIVIEKTTIENWLGKPRKGQKNRRVNKKGRN